MSDIKQENGYFRATPTTARSASAWARGDLSEKQKFSAAFPSKDPAAATTTPRDLKSNAPKIDADKPPAKAEPILDNKPGAPKVEPATGAQPQAKAQAPAQTPAEPKQQPIARAVPPAFAPIVAAGVLTSMQREKAAPPSKDDPASYRQGDEFKLGAGGKIALEIRRKGESQERNDNNETRTDAIIRDYMEQQQRQAFMQSIEYSVALDVTNRHIERQKARIQALDGEISVLRQRKADSAERVVGFNQKIEEITEHRDGLTETLVIRNEHGKNVEKESTMYEAKDKISQQSWDAQNSIKIDGKDVYVTVTEDRKPTIYKVDENGQKTKIDKKDVPTLMELFESGVFKRQSADGKIEYIDGNKNPLSQEKKDLVERALQVTGANPEQSITRHPNALAEERAKTEGVSSADIDSQTEKTNDSLARLNAAADKMKIPRDQVGKIEEFIQDNEKDLKELIDERDKEIDSGKLTEEERATKEAEKARYVAALDQSEKFQKRLKNSEFINEKEMLEAMPKHLSEEYDEEKEKALAAKNKGPAADNTARVSGSAAAKIESEGQITAGAKPTEQFKTAANATTPEVTIPAKTPEEELVVAAAARPTTTAPAMRS